MNWADFPRRKQLLVDSYGERLTIGRYPSEEELRRDFDPLAKDTRMPRERLVAAVSLAWLEQNPAPVPSPGKAAAPVAAS